MEPDIESCIGKLSALRNEVLEMNMLCDFMDSPCDAYTFKHRLKKCMKLLESLEDDVFICESLLCTNDEEENQMEQINYFEKIREYLNNITGISNKLASDITEKDLAILDAYACGIWALTDDIESEMKEDK